MFQIPDSIAACDADKSDYKKRELKYRLNQIVAENTYFDYACLVTDGGYTCDTIEKIGKTKARCGRMYMVHRPHRLIEILGTMKQYKLEPKRMKMVHPFKDKDANMVLIEAVRGGGAWMKVEAR